MIKINNNIMKIILNYYKNIINKINLNINFLIKKGIKFQLLLFNFIFIFQYFKFINLYL